MGAALAADAGRARVAPLLLASLVWLGVAHAGPISVSGVTVIEAVSVEPGAFCAGFALDHAQARDYFDRAEAISAKEMHDNYSHLPCSMRGLANYGRRTCSWEINAGGIARVSCDDGPNRLLGCMTCDHLLGE